MSDARGGLRLVLEAGVVVAVTAFLARVSWSAATQLTAPGADLVEFAEQVERLVGLAVTAAGTVAGVWLGAWYAACTACVLLAATGRRWRRLERLVLEHGPRLARRALAGALGVGLALGATGAAAAAQPMPAGAPGAGAATAPALAPRPLPTDVGDPLDLGWSSSSTPDAAQSPTAQRPSTEPTAAGASGSGSGATGTSAAPTAPGSTPAEPSPAGPTTSGPRAETPTGQPRVSASPPATTAPTSQSPTTPPAQSAPTSPPHSAPFSPPHAAPTSPPATTATSPTPTSEAPAAEPTEPSDASGRGDQSTPNDARVTVQRGDSLWSIAARHRPGATPAQTADDWPVWYRLNADVIGDDPHLIHPGQQLRIPAADDLTTA